MLVHGGDGIASQESNAGKQDGKVRRVGSTSTSKRMQLGLVIDNCS
jgi:hypothetical protein